MWGFGAFLLLFKHKLLDIFKQSTPFDVKPIYKDCLRDFDTNVVKRNQFWKREERPQKGENLKLFSDHTVTRMAIIGNVSGERGFFSSAPGLSLSFRLLFPAVVIIPLRSGTVPTSPVLGTEEETSVNICGTQNPTFSSSWSLLPFIWNADMSHVRISEEFVCWANI